MVRRLQESLVKKQHFVMFRNLLNFFKSNFKYYNNKWLEKLQIFNEQIYGPLKLQFSKSGKLMHTLKQSRKAYLKLKDHLYLIENGMKSYYSSCKNFQSLFVEEMIIGDISTYWKPSKPKQIQLKTSIRRAHDKLSTAKNRYEESLKGYNLVATQIINRNVNFFFKYFFNFFKSFAINSNVDYFIQSGILIKQCFETYLRELCKPERAKLHDVEENLSTDRLSYRANLTVP